MDASSEKFFLARLEDLCSQADSKGICCFSDFLDERQSAIAENFCLHNAGGLMHTLWGGHENASRKMLAVYPDYYKDYIKEEYPFRCITFCYRKEDRLTHRDFLGTLMGMQIRREKIGDIIVGEGMTQAFVSDITASFILTAISKVGRTGVKISDEKPFEMQVTQEFKTISGTVASMRLDCIVSLATGLSREKSAVLIRSEKVSVNHFPALSVSSDISENDIISIRGYGKFLLSEIAGSTRKNRIHVIVKKFV